MKTSKRILLQNLKGRGHFEFVGVDGKMTLNRN
jgi:hypothetical protein